MPVVAWTDGEGAPRHSSHTSLSHGLFPALAAHPRFMGAFPCVASSVLLGSGPVSRGTASPARPLSQPRPQQIPMDGCVLTPTWDTARAGQRPGTGGSCQSRREERGWGTEGCCGYCAGGCFPTPEGTLPCALLAQQKWGHVQVQGQGTDGSHDAPHCSTAEEKLPELSQPCSTSSCPCSSHARAEAEHQEGPQAKLGQPRGAALSTRTGRAPSSCVPTLLGGWQGHQGNGLFLPGLRVGLLHVR